MIISEKNIQLEMDYVLSLGMDTPFSPIVLKDLDMGEAISTKAPLCWIRKWTRKTLLQQLH